MSAAPMRKHTAPRNVPALASGRSSRVSVLGNTKLAIADAMKATEPDMLSHAIHQGKARNCRRQNANSQGRNRVRAGHEKQNRAEDVGSPDVLVGLCRAEVVHGRRERADVEEERPGKLRGCSQFLSCGRQAHGRVRTRVCWRRSSTPVIPGLCTCTY